MLDLNTFSFNELEQLADFLSSIDRNIDANIVLDYLANELAKGCIRFYLSFKISIESTLIPFILLFFLSISKYSFKSVAFAFLIACRFL